MAYATPTELAEHLEPDPAPANAARLLTRASRKVDNAIRTAVYDVDGAGMPTDTEVADALREATLEQISWWLDNGDDEGTGIAVSSASIGSVALTKASGAGGGGFGPDGELGEQAWLALSNAGLTGQEPWTY